MANCSGPCRVIHLSPRASGSPKAWDTLSFLRVAGEGQVQQAEILVCSPVEVHTYLCMLWKGSVPEMASGGVVWKSACVCVWLCECMLCACKCAHVHAHVHRSCMKDSQDNGDVQETETVWILSPNFQKYFQSNLRK